MSISFVIITHNLNEILTVKSKQIFDPVFREIIIINTGEKGSYPEVEKDKRVKIYTHEFSQYFPELKNFALAKVTSDWIFTLDTDELAQQELFLSLPDLIKNVSIEAYWFRRRTFIHKSNKYLKYGLFYPDWQLRLFRNKKQYIYSGGVHALLPIPQNKTKEIPLDILHYPTKPKYDSFLDFVNLLPYIKMDSKERLNENKSSIQYFMIGVYKFFFVFLSGFFRGKGFLDGWAGFRAHLLFSLSIGLSYIIAATKKIRLWNKK